MVSQTLTRYDFLFEIKWDFRHLLGHIEIWVTYCIVVFRYNSLLSLAQSSYAFKSIEVTHVLVTKGVGYIDSHATLWLLKKNYRVTIVVCLFIKRWFFVKAKCTDQCGCYISHNIFFSGRTICHKKIWGSSRFFKTYFQNLKDFNLFMLT